jgi:hypothetical protein
MTLDLDKLERLEREATAGPWYKHAPNSGLYTDADQEGHDAALILSHGIGAGYMKRDEDAAFIAGIRNAAPALVARARRADELEAENASLLELIERYERARFP